VTAWLDLSPDNVAHWSERANELYTPEGRGGKLFADPLLQSPIVGPEAIADFGLSRHDAPFLAGRLNGSVGRT